MTSDEFEILKQRVGKDYRVIMTNYPKVQVIVEKVDPFEDAKYVRERYSNIVRKVKGFDKDWLFTTSGIGVRKSHAEIVTETIYIDYLISKSKSLFGEIENGDEFEDINGIKTKTLLYSYSSFIYNNRYDQLFYGDVILYQAGKWAKRINQKVEVLLSGFNVKHYEKHTCFDPQFYIYNLYNDYDYKEIHNFLGKKLEEYLNEER